MGIKPFEAHRFDVLRWIFLFGFNWWTKKNVKEELSDFDFCLKHKPEISKDTRPIESLIDISNIYLKPVGIQYLELDNVHPVTWWDKHLGSIKSPKPYLRLKDLTNKEIEYLTGFNKKVNFKLKVPEDNKIYATLTIPKGQFCFCSSAYCLFAIDSKSYINIEPGMKFKDGTKVLEAYPFIVPRDEAGCKYKRYGINNNLIFWNIRPPGKSPAAIPTKKPKKLRGS